MFQRFIVHPMEVGYIFFRSLMTGGHFTLFLLLQGTDILSVYFMVVVAINFILIMMVVFKF